MSTRHLWTLLELVGLAVGLWTFIVLTPEYWAYLLAGLGALWAMSRLRR